MEATGRQRVSGDREREILDAAIGVLLEVGYDKLTSDLVAAQAHASKATLYRKWPTKADLVMAAVEDSSSCQLAHIEMPDTGTLVGDFAEFRRLKEVRHSTMPDLMGAVAPAVQRDDELRLRFVETFTRPRVTMLRHVLERARERGEIRADADLDLLAAVLPAFGIHHSLTTGRAPDVDYMSSVIEQVLLPAAGADPAGLSDL